MAKIASVIVGGTLLVLMLGIFKASQPGSYDPVSFDTKTGLVETLGLQLYSEYLLPFELASILFLVAMVGAVMLGKREVGDRHF